MPLDRVPGQPKDALVAATEQAGEGVYGSADLEGTSNSDAAGILGRGWMPSGETVVLQADDVTRWSDGGSGSDADGKRRTHVARGAIPWGAGSSKAVM